ncbi:MAG: hypothetical protein WAR41_17225, partial [Azonexus sp.]
PASGRDLHPTPLARGSGLFLGRGLVIALGNLGPCVAPIYQPAIANADALVEIGLGAGPRYVEGRDTDLRSVTAKTPTGNKGS